MYNILQGARVPIMNYVPAGGHEDPNRTGVIQAEHFLKFMNHSASHAKPSKE
jgi:hypothetical protein